MRVIICEKPSAARAVAAGIGGEWSRELSGGALRQGELWISWALGHLIELAPPKSYNPEWEKWRIESLPMIPETELLKLRAVRGAGLKERRDVIKKLLRDPELSEVINACDAGREGELIFDQLYRWAGCAAPQKRMWFSSLTAPAVRSAWESLLSEQETTPLLLAARARARADWIVGLNATRAATLALRDRIQPEAAGSARRRALSVGRVQTPTLAILVRRHREREEFQSSERFQLAAELSQRGLSLSAAHTDSPLSDHGTASRIASECEGQPAELVSWRAHKVSEPPPKPLDLGELQSRAAAELGWSASETLRAAQSLYERELISYPRSDSTQLSSDLAPQLSATLTAGARAASALGGGGEEPAWSQAAEGAGLRGSVFYVEPEALSSDHHAIIPVSGDLSGVPDESAPLLKLIWRRTLQALSDPAEWERGSAELEIAGHRFVSEERSAIEPGWRSLDPKPPAEGAVRAPDTSAPLQTEEIRIKRSVSEPPRLHTDGTLLRAMRSAGRRLSDQESREAMRESGLGTAATRAQIIERLISSGYVIRSGVSLSASPRGVSLIGALESGESGLRSLTEPELTGGWERRLREIERAGASEAGELQRGFDREIDQLTEELITGIRSLRKRLPAVAEPEAAGAIGNCPCCGEPLRESAKGFSCWSPADPGCGFSIYKRVAQKQLPKRAVRELIESGETSSPVKGFKSKAGKSFQARLRVDKKARRVEMVFE